MCHGWQPCITHLPYYPISLIDAGANPNVVDDRGVTPLCWAANGGRIEAARVLIANGVDTDPPLPGLLWHLGYAAARNRAKFVESFLQQIDVESRVIAGGENHTTLLNVVAACGLGTLAELIVLQGCNVDT